MQEADFFAQAHRHLFDSAVARGLPDAERALRVGPDENIWELGFLNSFGLVKFVVFLEGLTGREIVLQAGALDNFRTLRRIYRAYVAVRGTGILVTGASGVVGSALLTRHAPASPDLVALAFRRRPEPVAEVAWGDVRQRRMGLSEEQFADLAGRTRTVVHCAATTGFGRIASQDCSDTIGQGTAHVITFAREAGARLIYVSTAYVHPMTDAFGPPSDYQVAKRAAEQQVRESGLDYVILRPSVVVGDSATGAISQYQGMHFVLEGILTGELPVLPTDERGHADFISQDFLADVIMGLVAGEHAWGTSLPRELWLTQGGEAIPVPVLVSIGNEFARAHGLTRPPAKTKPYEVIERLFVPALLPSLPRRQRTRFESLLTLARYLNIGQPLPSDAAEVVKVLGIGELTAPRDLLERSYDYVWERIAAARAGVP
jgi:nucleoside-diphosphate-sugar epimerase